MRSTLQRFTFLFLLLACVTGNARQQILPDGFRLVVLSSVRAVIAIGTQRHVLQVGESTPSGVTLTDLNAGSATFSYKGKKDTISFDSMGTAPASFDVDSSQSVNDGELPVVALFARDNGFYHVNADINGQSMEFLVDTGADMIAMSSSHATALGIDLKGKQRGRMYTAGGIVESVRVTLSSVSVGEITIYDVDAAVIIGYDLALPLLGMSFLRHVDMTQQADRLELKQRPGF